MSDTKINAALLYQTLGYIESHPEEWDQGNWNSPGLRAVMAEDDDTKQDLVNTYGQSLTCGATGCFAGWAAVFAGARWNKDLNTEDVLYQGSVVHTQEAARLALGLTDEQSHRLFNGSNTKEYIRNLVREYADPEPKLTRHISVTVRGNMNATDYVESTFDNLLDQFETGEYCSTENKEVIATFTVTADLTKTQMEQLKNGLESAASAYNGNASVLASIRARS